MSTFTTATYEDHSGTVTGESPSPSPPPSPPPARPLTPLTPSNTFATSGNASIVAENDALADDLALELSFAAAMPEASKSSDDLLDHVETSGQESGHMGEIQTDDDASSDVGLELTQSEPDIDRSSGVDRALERPTNARASRSSSMPSRPLRSALARSPPPRTPDAHNGGKKKAHFDEGTVPADPTSDMPIGPPASTRHNVHKSSRFMKQPMEESVATPRHSASLELISNSSFNSAELAAAIGVFEQVVDELVEVAEEHAEAHSQLTSVAKEVADLIFERQTEEQAQVDEEGSTIPDINEDAEPLLPRKGSTADFDESCMTDSSTTHSDSESEGQDEDVDPEILLSRTKPEVIFITAEGEKNKLDLEKDLEENDFSTETVRARSSHTSEPPDPKRRVSVPEANATCEAEASSLHRRLSMSDALKSAVMLKLLPISTKSGPAACAVTACSVKVAEPANAAHIYTGVYDHPDSSFRQEAGPPRSGKTAQTEEPVTPGSSGIASLHDRPTNPGVSTPEDDRSFPAPPSPMQKVRTKLAVWSWAKEQGLDAEDGNCRWMPLLDPDGGATYHSTTSQSPRADERPLTPPNSHKTSSFLSPGYPASPARTASPRLSGPPSPKSHARIVPQASEDDDEPPLQLKAKSNPSRPCPIKQTTTHGYLSIPVPLSRSGPATPSEALEAGLPRRLSNLAAEETHFTSHRNSVDLLQERKQHEAKTNQQLMNSRDSVILARSKFDESNPSAFLNVGKARGRAEAMPSIADASPGDAGRAAGVKAMAGITRNTAPAKICPRVIVLDADEGEHES